MPSSDGGLGSALVGEKIAVNSTQVSVTKLLGEGGFAYVYLVKELGENDKESNGSKDKKGRRDSNKDSTESDSKQMVLKVTSILSRQQRDIAEKEATLLKRLSHPSIIKMYDTCYRTIPQSGGFRKEEPKKDRAQHLILMEYCEGGHAMDVCGALIKRGEKFDLATLIIAFGQICNAVSYLHAQRPPIIHRDLKPENFLIKNGAYKLCDFGSAVFGHIELKTAKDRADAEEVIQKTTTQMFRAPEMVDLYMAKKLTQATDVWALGCCLYSLAFLQNCFEEGSNLAILSGNYKIPDDNPYGEGLVELLDRMLTQDSKARADMTEVILCLSAVYSGKPLPPRKERKEKKDKKEKDSTKKKKEKNEKVGGTFRTDGQGMSGENLELDPNAAKKSVQGKKLDPNSAAARRRKAAGGDANMDFSKFDGFADFAGAAASGGGGGGGDGFENLGGNANGGSDADFHNAFASNGGDWKETDGAAAAFDALQLGAEEKKKRSRSVDKRRKTPRRGRAEKKEDGVGDERNDEDAGAATTVGSSGEPIKTVSRVGRSRGVRRVQSGNARSLSRGAGLRRTASMKAQSQEDDDDSEEEK